MLGGAGQRDSGTSGQKLLWLLGFGCPIDCPRKLNFVPAGAGGVKHL
jgi:hypothetical protein